MKNGKLNWLLVGLIACSSFLVACKKDETKKPGDQKNGNTKVTKNGGSNKGEQQKVTKENYKKVAKDLVTKGVDYIVSKVRKDGTWAMEGKYKFPPAVTALALKCILQDPRYNVNSPIVEKGFQALLKYQQKDGGIYDPKMGRSNYCTSIAVCALATANSPKYKSNLDRAVKFLRSIQIQAGTLSRDKKGGKEGEKIEAGHPFIGGVSYGKHGRPDMNNLGWWMQAMHEAGVKGDDPQMQLALKFVNRCQNRTESNDLPWAKEKGTNDGGMIYAPAKRDIKVPESKANPKGDDKNFASYGSISYAGMKSMLYANVGKNDPRVKELFAWLRRNWTLDHNPGVEPGRKHQGQYFYYNAMSSALSAFGKDSFKVKGNKEINWRVELVRALQERIAPDGSWHNDKASRWAEDQKILVTCYEVLALEQLLK